MDSLENQGMRASTNGSKPNTINTIISAQKSEISFGRSPGSLATNNNYNNDINDDDNSISNYNSEITNSKNNNSIYSKISY